MRIGVDIDGVLTDVKRFSIDLMIEDSQKNISQLSSVFPVICFATNYNKDCNRENVYRCYSWYDIYNKIIEISKGEK